MPDNRIGLVSPVLGAEPEPEPEHKSWEVQIASVIAAAVGNDASASDHEGSCMPGGPLNLERGQD